MAIQRIGWIGTGVMGASMCGHLMAAGHRLTIYNRSREKALSLIEKGADWADTPEQVSQESDIVFTMVGFPDDVDEVDHAGADQASGDLGEIVLKSVDGTPVRLRDVADIKQAPALRG